MKQIYPKKVAPLTWAAYQSACDRADRWMRRYYDAVARCEALEREIEKLRKEAD